MIGKIQNKNIREAQVKATVFTNFHQIYAVLECKHAFNPYALLRQVSRLN